MLPKGVVTIIAEYYFDDREIVQDECITVLLHIRHPGVLPVLERLYRKYILEHPFAMFRREVPASAGLRFYRCAFRFIDGYSCRGITHQGVTTMSLKYGQSWSCVRCDTPQAATLEVFGYYYAVCRDCREGLLKLRYTFAKCERCQGLCVREKIDKPADDRPILCTECTAVEADEQFAHEHGD